MQFHIVWSRSSVFKVKFSPAQEVLNLKTSHILPNLISWSIQDMTFIDTKCNASVAKKLGILT